MGDYTAARSGRRFCGPGPAQRFHPCTGGRLRLRQEQVQPCGPGLAPAGLQLQALHLLGGARKRLHARHCDQRRPAVLRCGGHRRPTLGAQELRRQVRRPHEHAHRLGEVQEHDLHPDPAGRRPQDGTGMGGEVWIRPRETPRLPDHGAGCWLSDASANGFCVFGVRQRRVPHQSLADRQGHRPQGPGDFRDHTSRVE